MATPATSSFSRAGIGFGVLLQTACVLFLVIAANYIGFNYYQRWDFSRSQRFTLAEQTKQALRQFPKQTPLKVIVYFSPTNLGLASALYGDVQNLLAELQFSARDRMQVDWVDPARDLTRARELQTKYKFDGSENLIILDYDGRTKFIPILDLGDFDLSGMQAGEPARVEAFKGEAVLTAAFIELLNPERARIYFLQGHGETPPSQLTRLDEFIARQNAECYALNLASLDAVPKDAGALCIVGARYDLSDRELEILRRYWQQNGRLVVLLDPNSNTPNLRNLLNAVCIYPRNDRVQRFVPSRTVPGLMGIYRDVAGVFLPDSPITKRLVGVTPLLTGGTLSLYLDEATAPRADIQLRPLIQAAEDYWGESHYIDTGKLGGQFDSEDTGQPVIVAASAEKGGSRDDRTDVATSRMVVVGNSTFVEDNALVDVSSLGNLDFMTSVVNRMIERTKLSGVAPRVAANFTLSLTEAQLSGIALYTLVLIPGCAALLGIIMGIRRRA
ncbi:MAG: GldG family protein [Terrimicrobiaceae bacterium]|nr:GldG family protein [Terrimicrobiaceae bacterium]